jgi:hypothetical protein
MTLRRIGVWPAAKITGALYAAMGLVFGAIVSVISLVGSLFNSGGPDGLPGILFGVGAFVFLPVLYGALGIAFGALTAALYNLFAGFIGGLELELESRPTL